MKHYILATTTALTLALGGCQDKASEKIEVVEIEAAKPLTENDHPYPDMEAAALKGNAMAQFNMGVLYDAGKEVIEDDTKAVEWYKRAADQGFVPAFMSLAEMYENGYGVEQDYDRALQLYKFAGENGNIEALVKLGYFYDRGEVVEKDFDSSVKWFNMAARRGEAEAFHRLGIIFGNAKGDDKDLVKSYMWSALAAEKNFSNAAKNQENVKAVMSEAQIAEAEALQKECRESRYKVCGMPE